MKSLEKPVSFKTKRMVLIGIFFAVAMVLSYVENILTLPAPPGIKLGLSNIVVMYSLFFLKKRDALALAVLKSLFVLITRGAVASLLSLSGGVLSILVMILVMLLFKENISYLAVSICGAIFHNIGQLGVYSLIFTNLLLLSILPILMISGILAGSATAFLLKVTMPIFKKLNPAIQKNNPE